MIDVRENEFYDCCKVTMTVIRGTFRNKLKNECIFHTNDNRQKKSCPHDEIS